MELPDAGVTIRVLVVADPAMAAAIEQLKGEWNARTESIVQVQQAAETDPISLEPIDVDAVICPSYHLGVLAEKQHAAPIPSQVLVEMRENWNDIFPLLRSREGVWGARAIGVSFGSPVLTCYYRADLLEKLQARPPRTWPEYLKLARLLADRKSLGDAAPPEGEVWAGALEPLGPGWAGLVLLARAAPYAVTPDHYSTLFQIDSMDPLIDGPPFVRALEELVATAKLGTVEPLKFDPKAVREAFWRGECGLAITWPTAADKTDGPKDSRIRAGFADLPGATEVYNLDSRAWEARPKDQLQVPLISIAGRAGLVTANSQVPAAALRLLFWLSGEQGRYVSSGSPSTTLFRQSQVRSSTQGAPRGRASGPVSQPWMEQGVEETAASAYGKVVQRSLTASQCLSALPIPGRAEYLAALDDAVAKSIRGEKSPLEALRFASAEWRKITARFGTDRQRSAYRHSLGLD